ncbi:hypothetical protein QJQ45_011427 [Haematococcus lacustris]|nr:hypothetical protein QJQ45_011427 [Haematococcus lacustris]
MQRAQSIAAPPVGSGNNGPKLSAADLEAAREVAREAADAFITRIVQERSSDSGKRPAADEPVDAPTKVAKVGAGQPPAAAATSEQHAATSEQPSCPSLGPAAAKPSAPAEQPPAAAKPATPAEQPPAPAKPATPSEQPPAAANPATPSEQPPAAAKTAAPAEQRPIEGHKDPAPLSASPTKPSPPAATAATGASSSSAAAPSPAAPPAPRSSSPSSADPFPGVFTPADGGALAGLSLPATSPQPLPGSPTGPGAGGSLEAPASLAPGSPSVQASGSPGLVTPAAPGLGPSLGLPVAAPPVLQQLGSAMAAVAAGASPGQATVSQAPLLQAIPSATQQQQPSGTGGVGVAAAPGVVVPPGMAHLTGMFVSGTVPAQLLAPGAAAAAPAASVHSANEPAAASAAPVTPPTPAADGNDGVPGSGSQANQQQQQQQAGPGEAGVPSREGLSQQAGGEAVVAGPGPGAASAPMDVD